MDSNLLLLLLLIIIPSVTAFVDCRTACRTCRENKQYPEVLEVHCAMCQECKERRQERMLDKANAKTYFREGSSTTESIILPHYKETSHYPENSNYPEIPQYTDTPDPEDCPTQPPCPDSEEYVPPSTNKMALTEKIPPATTTTTTTTTTSKPCATFKPCKKTTTQPPLLPTLPLVPIAPPPLYPVPGCYMPLQMQPMYPCPLNPYMGPPGLMPQGVMPPGFNMNQGKNYHGSGRVRFINIYENHGRYTDNNVIKESDENHGRYPPRYGRYTENRRSSGSSSPAEHKGSSVVVIKSTPAIMNLKAQTKKDFVYMYVGVPKSILKS